jgi:hypothetical protein
MAASSDAYSTYTGAYGLPADNEDGLSSVTPSQGHALGTSPSSFADQLDTLNDYVDTLAMANGASPEPRYSFSLDIGSVGPAIEPPYLPPTVRSLAGVTVTAPAAGLLSMMYADPSESPGLLTYDFSAVQRQEQLEAQAHAPVSAQDVAEFMKEQDIQFMTLPVSPLIGGFKSLVNFGDAALVRYGQFESVQALSQSAMYANSPEASSRMENEAAAAMNELNQSVPDTFTMSPVDRAGADALAIIGAGQMLLDAPTFISQAGTWIDRLSSPGVDVTIVPNTTAINPAVTAADQDVVLFSNKAPSDPVGDPKIVPNDRLSGISGKYNYVVTEDGSLIVGRSGHTSLTGGADVQAAGEIQLYNGNIKWIDNSSGHYQPFGPTIQPVTENTFNNIGLNATGKFQYRTW